MKQIQTNIMLIIFLTLCISLTLCKDVNFFESSPAKVIDDDDIMNLFLNSSSIKKNLTDYKYETHFENDTIREINSIEDLEEYLGQVSERTVCLENLTECINEVRHYFDIPEGIIEYYDEHRYQINNDVIVDFIWFSQKGVTVEIKLQSEDFLSNSILSRSGSTCTPDSDLSALISDYETSMPELLPLPVPVPVPALTQVHSWNNDEFERSIKGSADGRIILREYEDTKQLSTSTRKKLTNLTVAIMIEKYGQYPKKDIKLKYAQAIVKMFECYKEPGGKGYISQDFYHLYPKAGSIEPKLPPLQNKIIKVYTTEISRDSPSDDQFRAAKGKISKLLFSTVPSFDLTKVHGISKECRQQSAVYQRELKKFALWALKMYDSSAKVPSGLLNGNVNQYGDFDQCVGVQGHGVQGRYCLAYLQIEVPHSPYLAVLHDLVQSHSPFRSRLSDPGHRVPRMSTINWALCVPSACDHHDVEIGVQELVAEPLIEIGLEVQIEVRKEMCQMRSEGLFDIPLSTVVVGLFFLSIILLTFAASVYDYYSPTRQNEYLLAFSLIKNVKSLTSLNRSDSDIASVHGIRCLNALMLIIAHKSMAVFFNPYINRTAMADLLGRPWSVLGRAASLYTDPFIMLSGMLTAYSILGKWNRNQDVNIFKEYVSRLFRLVPTLGALILFCTFILPFVGSGPQWPLVINHHAEICKETWWRNLLFIHNYFGFKNMCLTHTHHVGIDTQLFAISPLLIFLIWKWPKQGTGILLGLATISTAMRYYVTYTMRLSNYVQFGASITQLFETADNMYILPAHRLTVYVMGILLAYVLRRFRDYKLDRTTLLAGNALSIFMFCAAFFGPAFMGSREYKYNPTHAAWYAAFAPIAWCFSFAWIIYTSHFGYNVSFFNNFGKIFSWRGFLITTRLSYAIYLTQFPVFFYNIGVTRSSEEYNFLRMQANIPETLNIILYAVILTLLFDTPFQNIKNILFRRATKKPQMVKKCE